MQNAKFLIKAKFKKASIIGSKKMWIISWRSRFKQWKLMPSDKKMIEYISKIIILNILDNLFYYLELKVIKSGEYFFQTPWWKFNPWALLSWWKALWPCTWPPWAPFPYWTTWYAAGCPIGAFVVYATGTACWPTPVATWYVGWSKPGLAAAALTADFKKKGAAIIPATPIAPIIDPAIMSPLTEDVVDRAEQAGTELSQKYPGLQMH